MMTDTLAKKLVDKMVTPLDRIGPLEKIRLNKRNENEKN